MGRLVHVLCQVCSPCRALLHALPLTHMLVAQLRRGLPDARPHGGRCRLQRGHCLRQPDGDALLQPPAVPRRLPGLCCCCSFACALTHLRARGCRCRRLARGACARRRTRAARGRSSATAPCWCRVPLAVLRARLSLRGDLPQQQQQSAHASDRVLPQCAQPHLRCARVPRDVRRRRVVTLERVQQAVRRRHCDTNARRAGGLRAERGGGTLQHAAVRVQLRTVGARQLEPLLAGAGSLSLPFVCTTSL